METPIQEDSFETHPLYRAALEAWAQGNSAQASAKLREVQALFPQEAAIQDLLVRTELKRSLQNDEPAPPIRHTPAPILRRTVLVLLLFTTGLAMMAGFIYAYDRIVVRAREQTEQIQYIAQLRQDVQTLTKAGDWDRAREKCKELLRQVPADSEALACLGTIQEQENLEQWYDSAISAQQEGNTQVALDLLRQIEQQDPAYRDVRELIASIEGQIWLEDTWQTSEQHIQNDRWLEAIDLLESLRRTNPEFRRSQVEEQLSQLYIQVAREQILNANGATDVLQAAVDYYDDALALRPTRRDWLEERNLADAFLAGTLAAEQQDWAEAVDEWETISATSPDYQEGQVRDNLQEAYPKAAKQLIAEASGRTSVLIRALGYLDQALALQPNQADMAEERSLVVSYLAGSEAYNQQEWDLAIIHWGAIYASRPTYQNGALEEKLKEACQSSAQPDPGLCPP